MTTTGSCLFILPSHGGRRVVGRGDGKHWRGEDGWMDEWVVGWRTAGLRLYYNETHNYDLYIATLCDVDV